MPCLDTFRCKVTFWRAVIDNGKIIPVVTIRSKRYNLLGNPASRLTPAIFFDEVARILGVSADKIKKDHPGPAPGGLQNKHLSFYNGDTGDRWTNRGDYVKRIVLAEVRRGATICSICGDSLDNGAQTGLDFDHQQHLKNKTQPLRGKKKSNSTGGYPKELPVGSTYLLPTGTPGCSDMEGQRWHLVQTAVCHTGCHRQKTKDDKTNEDASFRSW